MPDKTIRAAATLLLLLTGPAAMAAPDTGGLALPAACASVAASSLHGLAQGARETGFEATGFRVRLPTDAASAAAGKGPATAPSMEAARLQVTASGGNSSAGTSQAALERAASASAAALLIALTGSGHSGCDTGLLQDAGDPIVLGLQNGAGYLATWQGVTLRGHAGHVTASRMRLKLEPAASKGDDRLVQVTLTLDGVAGSLTPPTLLPDRLDLRVSLPASSLPTLLAATGGGAPDAQIPVTVEDIGVTSGKTVLHGHGEATAAATPTDSRAKLHLTAQHYDSLVYRAAELDLTRLHAALFLAGLVGHRDGDRLDWDINFADGVMAVNNVPIPIR